MIIGSAAGALIGVQFVVIALISNVRRRVDAAAISAFGTPTIVHFSGALTLSAMMTVPWPSAATAAIALATCGLGGIVYSAVVFRRARRQTDYTPVLEDWFWYTGFPCGTYAAVALAAVLMGNAVRGALFIVAGGACCLLLVGIHNAWDSVTHIVIAGDQSGTTKVTKE